MQALWAALIAGSVGLISALLSFLMAKRSLKHARQEAQSQRHLQLELQYMPKRTSALEEIWKDLYLIQSQNQLSPSIRDRMVMNVVWVDESLRSEILSILNAITVEGTSIASASEEVENIRKLILDQVNRHQP